MMRRMPEEEEAARAVCVSPQTTKRPSLIMWRVYLVCRSVGRSVVRGEVMFFSYIHSSYSSALHITHLAEKSWWASTNDLQRTPPISFHNRPGPASSSFFFFCLYIFTWIYFSRRHRKFSVHVGNPRLVFCFLIILLLFFHDALWLLNSIQWSVDRRGRQS